VSGVIGVLRGGALQGFAELRATYTWRTWTGGWLLRVLSQVMFFALLGRLLRSAERTQYLAVGNAVALVSIEAAFVIRSMCSERAQGTLPLILASPGSPMPVYLGRGAHWLCTGFLSSAITLAAVPWLLGVPLRPDRLLTVLPMLPVIGLSTYCYGTFMGALALRSPRWQWLVMNVAYLSLLTLSGVNVPLTYWPVPLRVLAQVLPLSHGLSAVRTALHGGPTTAVLGGLGLEVLVGAGWLALAAASGKRLISRGRVNGSVDFG
jgi:ABC-2 type transport system permease protein